MRLFSWAGAPCLLPVLVLLTVLSNIRAHEDKLKERHYYIAAVQIDWDYSGDGPQRSGPTHKKVVFREYERGFKQAKTHPSWLGLLGPTLRGQVGEVIVVTFRNMADRPYSIHPHGIAYGKQSEGAQYFDNTSQKEKQDDVVQPNGEHTYYWELTSEVAPQINDPDCLTYTYLSHFSMVQDYNSGLIGALLICKPGSLDESREQFRFHHEYVFLFGVFDERQSWYRQGHGTDNQVKYTINGYTSGSLPDVSICAHSSVSLHLMGMNSEPEVFSVHMNGQVFQQDGHKVSSVGLVSGSATTASMTAVHPGRWMLSSHTTKHLEAGLHGFVDVKFCAGFDEPKQSLTIQERRESKVWKYYIAAEELLWNYAPNMPDSIDKDYKLDYLTPGLNRIGGKYRKALYTQYTDDTFTVRAENQKRKDEFGILGPVIRAQIRDVIKIYFKNMASRPYSIYPHGLTIEKSEEGVNYPAGGNQTHGVQPGQTHIYTWKVVEQDEPLDGDSRCLTRMYHSAVDTPRDIASGLVGPILICKSQSLNVRNVQLKSDKEQHAMFAVFDENKSWYMDDNIRTYSDRSRVNKADPDFYKSNVMHTINGYVFESGQTLGFCNGEIATWHMSSIGAQDYIQTATFYGHTFELNERTEDFLSLFPMTGETISMNMDNIGIWLLASLNSHETTKGMRVKFRDVECFRDYQYEYEDYEGGNKDFITWISPEEEELEKKEEALTLKNMKEEELPVDDYTAMFADELGLRSHKNKSKNSDMEELDLSSFDNGVSERDVNATVNLKSVAKKGQMENDTVPSEPESNSTLDSDLVVDDYTAIFPDKLGLRSHKNKSQNLDMEELDLSSFDYGVSERDVDATVNLRSAAEKGKMGTDSVPSEPESNSTVLEDKRTNLTQKSVNQSSVNMIQGEDSEERITRGDVFYYSETDLQPISNTTEELVLLDANAKMGSASDNETTMKEDLSSGQHVLSTRLINTTIHNVSLSFTMGNITTEASNVTDTLSGHASSVLEDKQVNPTQTSVNQSSANMTQVEDSEDKITRGDVFYSDTALNHTSNTTGEMVVPDAGAKTGYASENETSIYEDLTSGQNVSSTGNVSLTAVSSIENITALNPNATLNISKDVANHSLANSSAEASNVNTSNTDNLNLTSTEVMVEGRSNMTSVNGTQDTTVGQEYGNQINSSSEETNSSVNSRELENNMSISSNESMASSDSSSSEEGSEEVVIYLKNNSSEAIITTSLHSQEHSWIYNGTHQTVPMELPDHMIKYISNDPPKSTAPPTPTTTKKPKRTVNLRQWPQKGHSMKTRRRKAYKPQARTGLPVLPFSPRGLNPGLSPRGSRPTSNKPQPISNKEDLLNTPVVIGVPRPDFSEYMFYVPGEDPDHLDLSEDVKENEYEYVSYIDPYSSHKEITLDETTKYYLKTAGTNVKTYFISAEEVVWDYGGYGHRRQEKTLQSMDETKFTKVVFRQYLDSDFTTPDIRGELEEHLGLLGPLIKAEVGQSILVIFRNKASRPYSLHPNGVTYNKQAEGLEYDDESKYWYKYDNEVQPNSTFTYLWKVPDRVGPTKDESSCRTWAYYSGVNPERDIHSGLIGPLLVCRQGTLPHATDMREFVLLFMTFDETRSWYYDKNREIMERTNQRAVRDPNFRENLKFPSINGIVYSLKGLRMYTDQMVRWHLLNMGSQRDVHSVYFHGQTFLHKQTKSYRQAVFPLLPGGFATLEMKPAKPGLWQLETEVGFNQQKGMQTLFLVLDKECDHPLGLSSGSVKDNQITANHTRGYWVPHLARLNNQGKYNAWSTEGEHNWIQVDFLRPVVISQVATQGARQMFHSQYVTNYTVSYSTDRRKWFYYKGDSNRFRKIFPGNQEAYDTKVNTFFPPLIGRFIRLHPVNSYNNPTLRMEFYGCELDGCSVPLGMESRLIEDGRIKASSTATSWYSGPWQPSLARLNMQGTINAWQAKTSNMHQWLQVELAHVKKITGIITQGAKSIGTEMYVISYALQYSNDGVHWSDYTDDPDYMSKTFIGNTDNNGHVKNYIYPPIFSRFIRILPRSWRSSITMRIELLGCDFE